MKKLFLASVARNVLNRFIESLDNQPAKLKVAFVPTAGKVYAENQNWFVTEDRDKLVKSGFNVFDLNLENKTYQQLKKEINDTDIIFVAGGNTFYLLQETLKSGFDKVLTEFINNGGLYIGSSAGTLLVGPSIELAQSIDDPNDAPELNTFQGLGLINFVIMPHYDDPEFKKLIDKNLRVNKNLKYRVIKITDNQAVVVTDNDFEIIEK